jgi:hypothetical protein
VGGAHQGIGRMLLMVDRHAEAERALRAAVGAYGTTLGAEHPWTLVAEVWVVTAMTLQGDARGPVLLDRAARRLRGVGLDGDTRFSLRAIADELEEAGYETHAEAFRALVAADEAGTTTAS